MNVDRVRVARRAFQVLAAVLVVSVLVQVFLAGAGVFVDPAWWPRHATFVHVFELVPILMALAAWAGRGTWRLVVASLAAWFLIGLQYALAGAAPSLVAALHAVNALVVFGLALALLLWPRQAGADAWKA